MDVEDKKVGLKKRPKLGEIKLDSDDDEPIGSLLKLKKRSSKKAKLGVEGQKDKKVGIKGKKDEDFGGMEDTLASFRKKLKGPKKDSGCGSSLKMASKVVELPAETVSELQKDKGLVAKLVQDVGNDVADVGSDVTISKISEKRDVKVKRSKSASPAKSQRDFVDDDVVGKSCEVLPTSRSKQKKMAKWSKSSLVAKDYRASSGIDGREVLDDKAVNDQEQGKEGPSIASEALVESLSSFLKKAQSSILKKPRAASGSKSRRGLHISGNDSCLNSNVMSVDLQAKSPRISSDEKLCTDNKKLEDSMSGSCQMKSISPQYKSVGNKNSDVSLDEGSDNVSVGLCKSTDCVITDGNDNAAVNCTETALDHSIPTSGVPVSNAGTSACSQKMQELTIGKVCGEDGIIQLQPLVDTADGLCNKASYKSSAREVCASVSQEDEFHGEVNPYVSSDAHIAVPDAACSILAPELVEELTKTEKHEAVARSDQGRVWHGLNTTRVVDQDMRDDDPMSTDVNETANGSSSPSVAPDENGDFLESKNQCNERAVRRVRKRKDGDMAYEGDADWEVLMHARCLSGDKNFGTYEYYSSNADPDLEKGAAAAVSVGLKARAVSPVEKIKFKEVLRRKSGLQQYLDCRNKILSLWSKDVTRILPLTDCGITKAPSDKEPFRASLMRDIYSFLDQSGYINAGIAADKDKAEPSSRGSYKLLGEKKFEGSSGASIADSADGVSFILGQVKGPDTLPKGKDDVASADENHFKEAADTQTKTKDDVASADENHLKEAADTRTKTKDDVASPAENLVKEADEKVEERVLDLSNDNQLDGQHVGEVVKQLVDVKLSERVAEPDCSGNLLGRMVKDTEGLNQSMIPGNLDNKSSQECEFQNQKKIIVVGAGPAGLTAARHLQRQGYSVTVLEARSRIGGRVHTDHLSLSVPVDLGASIITGVEADVASERRPDPSSLICAQLGLELTILNSDCPLYDVVTGQKVASDVDESLEAEFNSLLDDMMLVVAQKGESATRMSLEDGLEFGLKIRRKVLCGPLADSRNLGNGTEICLAGEENGSKDGALSHIERRVMDWHFAHLEYGCAAMLKDVSLPHWNQDDIYGGFGGAHCMIKGGYGAVVESIALGLPIHFNQVVADISYGVTDSRSVDNCSYKVKVFTSNGDEFFGDAVLITVPLGCLKADSIKFSPPLPEWKHSAIRRLGFGVLNKVVLEFSEVFWDDTVDYFGATAENTDLRGRCFMFWNVKKTVGAPVLIALVVGKAAVDGQDISPSCHVSHALAVLRKLFGHAAVPDPVGSVVTDWGRDPFSYGAYSYVAVGASGEDYDILGRPVEKCLFFAGEATCKEHPDTVGGAMMSGLREAVRIIDILTTGNDYTAEAEAVDAGEGQSTSHRTELKDIARRLDAVSITNAGLTRESLLQDLFFSAKTSAGRLRLAKELLTLHVESLKLFAGTKEGLNVLNSWILDSLGKDGTQLLRHCVRLLVLVSTDLVAVRLSGIGKTVKEKVCVHTSRDIRGIASQLVTMWIEVFRKEKATNGGLKLLRHMTNADSTKAKRKDLGSRKPPKRAQQSAAGNKLNLSSKKLTGKQVKPETHSSISQMSKAGLDSKSDDAEDVPMSEEEQAAVAAAEAAHAAARAAIEAYASSEARSSMKQLPKIPSFQKFARREQYAQMDEEERKRWAGGVLGRQDCASEIDSRNCRVRDWSVDFSATCANLEKSRLSVDNLSQRSNSNDVPCHLNWREHSGESAAGDNTAFTKAWVESSGSDVLKDYHAIERWQCQAAAAEYEFQSSMHIPDEEDSSTVSKLVALKHEGLVNESSVSQVTVNNELTVNQRIGTEHIKQGVVDYVASLLMPLYKARKIDKEGYKSIMKKSATKVMEQTTDAEKAMSVSEFLDFKRKNKIRAFVDKLIEKHMSTKRVPKP